MKTEEPPLNKNAEARKGVFSTWEKIKNQFYGKEFEVLTMALSVCLVALIMFLMNDRYALMAERCMQLERHNAELRVMLDVENLVTGEDLDKLQRYREYLVKKFSGN